ncbi:MAG: YkgJ family cysteine cluster protein [Clostridiales bacterium]|nr:YkgJ family cysteine cluster protein [Clostridiales bacterium]
MKRQVSLEEISDGRLYDSRDMARIGCGGCRGCSACCRGMGKSAILDPMDFYRLGRGLGATPNQLLEEGKVELNVVDGVILPNLRMDNEADACGFLNAQGRCSIHAFRPGVCRLFPLGRFYEKDSFRYFSQIYECPAPNKTKVRIEKWLEQPDLPRYEAYILEWHQFLEQVESLVTGEPDEERVKNINLYVLQLFFLKRYDWTDDFYAQFHVRLTAARDVLDFLPEQDFSA